MTVKHDENTQLKTPTDFISGGEISAKVFIPRDCRCSFGRSENIISIIIFNFEGEG